MKFGRFPENVQNLCLAGLVLVALGTFVFNFGQFFVYTMDDAFITFRYGRNLAEGFGPNFNKDIRAEGYTTPLYMLFSALVHWISADPIVVFKAFGILCLLTMALIFVCQGHLGVLCAAFVLLLPQSAFHANSGMETALFTLLILAVFVLIRKLKNVWSEKQAYLVCALLLLLGLCRPEGNLIAGAALVLLVAACPSPKRTSLYLKVLGLYLSPALIYFVWRYQYYGYFFPLTFYSKVTGGSPGYGYVKSWFTAILPIFGVTLFLAVKRRNLWDWVLLLLFATIIGLFVKSSPVMGEEMRFLYPITVLLLFWLWHVRPQRVFLFLAILALGSSLFSMVSRSDSAEIVRYGNGLKSGHITLGQILAKYTDTVGERPLVLTDAGAVPYYSRFKTIDIWSLNEPRIIMARDRDPSWVLNERPSIFVYASHHPEKTESRFAGENQYLAAFQNAGYERVGAVSFNYYYLMVFCAPDLKEALCEPLKADLPF